MVWGNVVIVIIRASVMHLVMRIAPDAGASGDELLLGLLRRPDSGFIGRVFRIALGDGLCDVGALVRIGILSNGGDPKNPLFEAFSKKMAELGYTEGRNLVTEFRSADADVDRLNDLAMGWFAFRSKSSSRTAAHWLSGVSQRATSTIPSTSSST